LPACGGIAAAVHAGFAIIPAFRGTCPLRTNAINRFPATGERPAGHLLRHISIEQQGCIRMTLQACNL
jgi:hypothetical protein